SRPNQGVMPRLRALTITARSAALVVRMPVSHLCAPPKTPAELEETCFIGARDSGQGRASITRPDGPALWRRAQPRRGTPTAPLTTACDPLWRGRPAGQPVREVRSMTKQYLTSLRSIRS